MEWERIVGCCSLVCTVCQCIVVIVFSSKVCVCVCCRSIPDWVLHGS